MPSFAAELAPHLSGTLVHPGDPDTGVKPSQLAPLPVFQQQTMLPPGMAQEMAEQAGLPHPNLALLYTEAWIHALETVCGVTIIDNAELADLRAAAAVKEHKRNQVLEFQTPCGHTLRAMVRGFDTQRPRVPCELVNHECSR